VTSPLAGDVNSRADSMGPLFRVSSIRHPNDAENLPAAQPARRLLQQIAPIVAFRVAFCAF
jgi:hypothetical protein